jgi:hypothetical protein
MRSTVITLLIALFFLSMAEAQNPLDEVLPVRGLCIGAPSPEGLDPFIQFIKTELAPRKVNTLIVRIDFEYEYESHPELRDENPLSKAQVKKLVAACRESGIRLIPQINLLGHQSWASKVGKLLEVYPQFDETPHVQIPAEYKWPNPDGLYCKSYCPLHPDVHKVVFALVDEVMDAFEADAFHAGMDEVFYIGDDKCPRCYGHDKAELFAGEVTKIRNHLALKNRELWIWGDRLLDGKATGLGMWEASMNNTHRAIDMIPKDVFICDWHYERPDATAVIFASKGFRVATCPWRHPDRAVKQLHNMMSYRDGATEVLKPRYAGMIQTVWSGADNFLEEFRTKKTGTTSAACFIALFDEINKLKP